MVDNAARARSRRRRQPASEAIRGATVLVTGAGSGIGRATCLAVADAGATAVIAVDIDAESAERVALEAKQRGAAAAALTCDVSDWSMVRDLAATVAADHGPVDILVNNAGVGLSGRLLDLDIDDWEWIRSINLDGVVHGCRAFGPAMVERGRGHVVNLSSVLGFTPRAAESTYVATKAAVLALSQSLRADWRPRGVSVSAICPGVINTPILEATRFLGAENDPTNRERTDRLFRRGHAPELVARAIIDAVARDKAIVPVGWEATIGWWAHRLAPVSIGQLVAGREIP